MTDLSKKRSRDALEPRREPYWQRLAEGVYLGFRRGPDTWIVRCRGRDERQQYKSLGEQADFDLAKKQADEWVGQLQGTAVRSAKRSTIKAALEAYLTDLRRQGRMDTAKEAEGRFKKTVYEDSLADLELEEATKDDFLDWRDRLKAGRQPRSVNRQVRAVVAGLNKAHDLGHVGNPRAWMLEALQDDVEDGDETAVFLTPAQRTGLISMASKGVGEFLRGLELTGARPKELESCRASDFDGKVLKLSHRKGRPPKLRVRYVVLAADGIAFFKRLVKGKLPDALIFTQDDGVAWDRFARSRHVRAAIAQFNENKKEKQQIPLGASAYSFRHARISELLQVHNVDPLTVAAQTGTSLAMIEKNYFKFIPDALKQKLKATK